MGKEKDIAAWLGDLGLAQYVSRFVQNDIDVSLLPSLTDQDLKDLGIASVGHRRRILVAIAARDGAAQGARPAQPAVEPMPAETAERRQLSIMFCDLVDSTMLSSRLDPEDMREVIGAYQAACSRIIQSYGGAIGKFMGDGVLAYFGFPIAYEHDAERAARAALEIVVAVERLSTRANAKLKARVGIATGLVVIGDLIGEGSAQEQAVVGDAPNLAARLQSLADPGCIVVSEATRRLIGDLFHVRSLGRHSLKGFSDPVEAWGVEGFRNTDSRFEAAHSQQLTGFIGREKESALLVERLKTAWRGEGQIVLISGEAGIGKSRFAAWLSEWSANEQHTRLRYQCSPYHRDSSLYPFIQQLERAADIKADDPADTKLTKLEAVLEFSSARAKEIAPLFAALLSIPVGSRYPSLSLSSTQQRRRTLEALLEQLQGLTQRGRVLMLFEDAHWADATSLELIDLAIERLRQLPVLLLITFRPEFEPPWEGLQNVTRIALDKLDQGQVEALAGQMTGGRKLPAEVIKLIVAKTDGVPLFVEELTKTIQESGLLISDGERYRLNGPLPPLAIPSTLQDSLMARLDRLSPLKEIVQTGAAIGREFSYALLQAATGKNQPDLVAALAELEEAGLLFHTGVPPDARYIFKHALVQDAAYESLLKSRRQVIHLRIAEVLRDRFVNVIAAEPEVLAHHFTQAGASVAAVEWWSKAGDLAFRRAAFAEAASHLRKAVDIADQANSDANAMMPIAARLKMQIALGQALVHCAGWTAPQTTAAFARAREIATAIEDPAERMKVYYGLWGGSYVSGELAGMRETAEAFLNDVKRRPGSPEECVAYRLMGATCWFCGDYDGARSHHAQAVRSYDENIKFAGDLVFGHDDGVATRGFSALALWPLGDVDGARRLIDEALAMATRTGHVPTVAWAQFHACLFEIIRGDAMRSLPYADKLFELCGEFALGIWMEASVFLKGWSQWLGGEQAAGLAAMRQGLALIHERRIGVYMPFFGMLLGRAESQTSGTAAGLAAIDDTLAECQRAGQHWLDAELLRLRAELLLKLDVPDPRGAEAALRSAVAIAERQGTRSFALRATVRLAHLLRELGETGEAAVSLERALMEFKPTPEFPDVAQAQSLLRELALDN